MPATRVEVVVLTFDAAPGMLEDAVRSVLDHVPDGAASGEAVEPLVEVHVVDNGTQAAQRLAAATWRGRPLDHAVRLTVSAENRGYAGGMNIGLDASPDADVVVLLNDDVTVTDGWLEPLLAEFEVPDVGAAQPLLLSPGGAEINSAGVVIDRFGAGSDRLRGEPASAAGSGAIDIDVFTGGAVALSRVFIDDVGSFDERFFLYYEDVDLARRGTRAGWRYRFVPTSRVEHRGSATTADLGDRVVFLRERNRLWSTAVHGSFAEVGGAVWLSIRRLRHHPRRVHARALAEGLAGGARRLGERAIPKISGLPGATTARRVRRRASGIARSSGEPSASPVPRASTSSATTTSAVVSAAAHASCRHPSRLQACR